MAHDDSQFSALILLSASYNPQLEAALREVLAPFALTIIDLQQISLRGRLIIGVHIACDPAHVLAIEADLLEFGEKNGVDIAIDYSEGQ